VAVGFEIEAGKHAAEKIERPVFYGENGVPELRYHIDAYHPVWKCGLEIKAGRGWMGNAVYRDLVQALVMVQVDHLFPAVANQYTIPKSAQNAINQHPTFALCCSSRAFLSFALAAACAVGPFNPYRSLSPEMSLLPACHWRPHARQEFTISLFCPAVTPAATPNSAEAMRESPIEDRVIATA
jgi:hypothetical protein